MELRQAVGLTVRDRRTELRFTQEELAFRAGLHRTYINDVERGRRNISLDTMEKIAAALQTPLPAFFDLTDEKRLQPLQLLTSSRRQPNGNARPVEILIVEDDPNFVELTLHTFKTVNMRNTVHVVRDGAEALDFLFAQGQYRDRAALPPPSLILLDLKLPKVDGVVVLTRLRAEKRTASIPVIIMTSSRSEEDQLRTAELGVLQYLTKPVSIAEFSRIAISAGMQWLLVEHPAAVAAVG